MTTREAVLHYLQQSPQTYCSGSEIARELGMTRAGIWKQIQALQGEGYPIEGIAHKGYRLTCAYDYLSAQRIKEELGERANDFSVTVEQCLPSTNRTAKEMAQGGAPHGTVVIAEEQTAGRGRLGRSFYSPDHTGLYISLLLRPGLPAERSLFLTTAAAVALSEVLEEISGRAAQIKWVNDIFMDSKKVAGILTEASVNLETGILDWAVVGIGVNLFLPKGGFPPQIADTAGAVLSAFDHVRNKTVAKIISSVERKTAGIATDQTGTSSFIEDYRRRSYLTGKEITILSDPPVEALCEGVDTQARLLARLPDGTQMVIAAGDVSVRAK